MGAEVIASNDTQYVSKPRLGRHILVGVAAGLVLIAFYLSLITLAESWSHAVSQFRELVYWIVFLAAGFGTQAGLFSFIRQGLRERRGHSTASVATSGGVSAGSMAACCAHHLADILPVLGFSGLAAFLATYQVVFLVIGILANIVGITIMLEVIQHHALCPLVTGLKWDMGMVKRWTMFFAVLVVVGAVLRMALTG